MLDMFAGPDAGAVDGGNGFAKDDGERWVVVLRLVGRVESEGFLEGADGGEGAGEVGHCDVAGDVGCCGGFDVGGAAGVCGWADEAIHCGF